jgi:dipeptidyl aminopeptidase/acylaminoacyl peptidase
VIRVRLAVLFAVAICASGAAARPQPAQAPPDTEIYLAPLRVASGEITVGDAENITNNPGYDNQPFFTPDGRAILFTSIRPAPGVRESPANQTDIFRYDIATRRTSRVTQTPESEYSPTVMPDGMRISVVRVEGDGTQRLWSVTPNGPKTQFDLLLPAVKPVGYHAWADEHTVALFVLGEPATLQLADLRTGSARVIAKDIGRSLQQIAGAHRISFVQHEHQGDQTRSVVMELDPGSGSTRLLTPAVEGSKEADCAWTPDGALLMAHGGTLYAWREGQSGWKAIASVKRLSLAGVTRLAVSPRSDWLALVAPPRPRR